MSRLLLGIICGLVFGAVAVATMLPLQFEDKRAAMLGAFINRFSVGLVIGAATLPLPAVRLWQALSADWYAGDWVLRLAGRLKL